MPALARWILLCGLVAWGNGASQAQQSQMFGPYELHYSVVNTTFLAPKVAAAYNLALLAPFATTRFSLLPDREATTSPCLSFR